jgi:NTE family protein
MRDEPLGLVLASGGARGAYQAGALLHLAEQGVRFTHLSGTSIGSLNAAFYAQGDGSKGHMESLCALWREISSLDLIQMNGALAGQALAWGASFFTPTYMSWFLRLSRGKFHILDPRPMANLIKSRISPDKIRTNGRHFFVAALPSTDPALDILLSPWLKPVFFRADTLEPTEIWSLLTAAAAIPLAFPSQKVGSQAFSDAGLVAALPTRPLYEDGCRNLFTIFLSEMTIQNQADFPDATLFELRPSVQIDSTLLKSTLDFSPEHIQGLMDLGYQDCRKTYGESREMFDLLNQLKNSGDRLAETVALLPNRILRKEHPDREEL